MKRITINKIEYKLCEDATEVNAKIYPSLLEWYLHHQTGVAMPNLKDMAVSLMDSYNKMRPADAIIKLNDFIHGIDILKNKSLPLQMLFSMIVLEDDESQYNWTETSAKQKLEKMFKDGLTEGQIEEIILPFCEASSTHLINSFRKSFQQEQEEQTQTA